MASVCLTTRSHQQQVGLCERVVSPTPARKQWRGERAAAGRIGLGGRAERVMCRWGR